LSLRFISVNACVRALCVLSAVALTAELSPGQQPAQTPAAQASTAQTTTPAAQTPAPTAAPAGPKVPDYPDKRSFVISAYYLSPLSSNGPNIEDGDTAGTTYETLLGLGKYSQSVAAEIGVPITRTGMLYLDVERFHGNGNQSLTQDATINGYPFSKSDYISSNYRVTTGRLYLDDLLWPHKFPVARLRFKSIWAIRYTGVHTTVDAPFADQVAGIPGQSTSRKDTHIFLPEFGLAMEYAIAPHVLLRIDGAGFGIPSHSAFGEASGTIAVRQKHVEVVGGVRMMHFRTSPQSDEYEVGTMTALFGGLRWHW
jgi:hypothetical protein